MRFACLVLLVTACATTADAPDAQTPAPVDDSMVFRDLSITVGPNGVASVDERTITAGQERIENAARLGIGATPLIYLDWTCSKSSFVLFDQAGFVGNRVCITEYGRVSLFGLCSRWTKDHEDCVAYRDFVVSTGSYISGNWTGHLEVTQPMNGIDARLDPSSSLSFGPHQSGELSVAPRVVDVLQLDY